MSEHPELPIYAEYQDQLIAFVDILGWKSLVEKSANDLSLLRKLATLSYVQSGMGDIAQAGNGIRHIRMSDASVFVANPNSMVEVATLVDSVISVHTTALMHGWLARGSIVFGKIYYKENPLTILGPGLTTAYESENGLAVYPRTVVDERSASLIEEMYSRSGDIQHYRKLYPKTNGVPLHICGDDLPFVSYLGGFMQSLSVDFFRRSIIEGLSSYRDDEKVFKKYSWLKNYYNSCYSENI